MASVVVDSTSPIDHTATDSLPEATLTEFAHAAALS